MGSVERAFSILEAVVSKQDSGLSFIEIVNETGTPKATAHRILKDLVRMGFLSFTQETGRYRGSLKLAGLGAEVMANFDLRSHAHPHLIDLRRETDHTCHLGIREGEIGVYVDKVVSHDYGIKLFSEIGKSFPLHCTGLGKSLLAHTKPEITEEILSKPLDARTHNTITDPGELKRELARVREQGYAVDHEEITRGLICVAAPCFLNADKLIGAISVTFPSYIKEERGIDAEIEAVLRHAREISGSVKKT